MANLDGYSNYDGVGLAKLVEKGEVTPSELLEDALSGIEAVNEKLNGVTARIDDMARAEASSDLHEVLYRCSICS